MSYKEYIKNNSLNTPIPTNNRNTMEPTPSYTMGYNNIEIGGTGNSIQKHVNNKLIPNITKSPTKSPELYNYTDYNPEVDITENFTNYPNSGGSRFLTKDKSNYPAPIF